MRVIVSVIRQKSFVSRGSTFHFGPRRTEVPEPLAPLSLVEYVAVWALKLPALHTDVLKTHEFQSFSAKLLEFNKWHPPNHLLPCLNTMADTLYVSVCGQVIAADFSGIQ